MGEWVRWIDVEPFRQARLPDQRLHESVRVGYIVEAKATFHTQSVLVGRAVVALHKSNTIVLNLVADLTAHATIGTDRVNLPIHLAAAMLGNRIDDGFRH